MTPSFWKGKQLSRNPRRSERIVQIQSMVCAQVSFDRGSSDDGMVEIRVRGAELQENLKQEELERRMTEYLQVMAQAGASIHEDV